MMQSDHNLVTRLLCDAAAPEESGRAAIDQLLPIVYDQLVAQARNALAAERNERRGDHTLAPTALVHEAYLKLVGPREIPWQNRAHFYAAAAEAMRRILIDHARARGREKRGGPPGSRKRVPLNLADVADSWNLEETMSLDNALRRLGEQDASIGEVVRLRFFAGLSIEQTAAALDISPATVKRRWEFGRTWLYRELQRDSQYE